MASLHDAPGEWGNGECLRSGVALFLRGLGFRGFIAATGGRTSGNLCLPNYANG